LRRFLAAQSGAPGAAGLPPLSSPTTLRSELQSGKSLAQIASSTTGKSVEGLKAAIVAAEKAGLEKAVSSGSITSPQEQERLGNLSSRIEAMLQRTGVGGWDHGGSGFGPHRRW
jgi:hypothetical protein